MILLILALFALSASGLAESLAHAERNAWSKCLHTKQRIERNKPCPCGCKKKAKPSLRITTDHADCDADDVVAHAPAFSGLESLIAAPDIPAPTLSSVAYFVHYSAANSLLRPPLRKPG